jgi:hypothetical protein
MTKGVPKKRQRAEQLRKKRAQAAPTWAAAAKTPPKAIPIAQRRARPSVGFVEAVSESLPPAHYPAKRVAIGKRQVPGGAG